MKRFLQRLLIIGGATGGLVAAVQSAANAGVILGNHSEPIATDRG